MVEYILEIKHILYIKRVFFLVYQASIGWVMVKIVQ